MKSIAVVEDEVYMREELCDMLQKDGYLAVSYTHLDVYKRQVLSIYDHIPLCRFVWFGLEQ